MNEKATGMLGRHEDKADSRDNLEAAAQTAAGYIYGRGFTNGLADAWNDDEVDTAAIQIIQLLDRQAAITKKGCADSWQGIAEDRDKAQMRCAVLQAKVDELTKERNEFRAKIDIFGDETCGNGTIKADLEQTHMRLPVDADGVPIRPGDVVCYFQDGQRMHVHGVCEDGLFYTFEGEKGQAPMPPSDLRHVKPDTVESLLNQFQAHITDDMFVCDLQELIDEYAERIRKAVER